MAPQEFVKEVKDCQPDRSYLVAIGLPEETVNALLDNYEIPLKKLPIVETSNPILNLMNRYNLRGLEISGIVFFEDYHEFLDRCIAFAAIELDMVCIAKKDGKIYLVDHGENYHTHLCADSSERFLRALIELMRYTTEIIYERQVDTQCEKAAAISRIASDSEESLNMYKMLMGCFE